MAANFSFHHFNSKYIRAGTAIILHFAALLRPIELFSLTWEDVLLPGDVRLEPHGLDTGGILVRNAKKVLQIAQKQFVPITCPAAITLLMNLRANSELHILVFDKLSYPHIGFYLDRY